MKAAPLLSLLLIVGAPSAASTYYNSFGGSVAFTSKGSNSDGTYEVEIRQRSTPYLSHHPNVEGVCWNGYCGSQTQHSEETVSYGSYGLTWRQYEVTTTRKVSNNLPFEMRFPDSYEHSWGLGYWYPNIWGSYLLWSMMIHVDLGVRSDTGEPNRPPVIITPHVLRVPRNCPRTFRVSTFDPDGDRVRCRIPTSSSTHECGICSLVNGFSFDQNSCSFTYIQDQSPGYYPIELMVEDFPKKDIRLSYSDGSSTIKCPQTLSRRKRQALTTTTSSPTTTRSSPTTTRSAPTTTRSAPTTTRSAPTTTRSSPTTTRSSPTTTRSAPTTTTSSPTTTTSSPTTTTFSPTTTTFSPTTTTFSPTTTRSSPTTTRSSPTTTPFSPTTTTSSPTTTTSSPTTTRSSPTTTRSAPTTTTSSPTTTRSSPTTTRSAPTTTTSSSTTTTSSPTTTTFSPTTTTSSPTTTRSAPTTTTFSPTTTTSSPTTTTSSPTTTTSSPTTTTSGTPTIGPLSKLPIQFTVLVDSHNAPSCLDGDYFPIFLAPTPANGVHLPAYINHTLEIKIRSKAEYTTIHDLIVTGPSRISKESFSADTYLIKWTPTEDELNDHFPVCFVSEGIDEYNRVYHSELRCVTVVVGQHDAVVTCSETTMTVEVAKTYIIRRNEKKLHLHDFTGPSCNLENLSNDTHVVAVMSLNACGTYVEEDNDNIYFRNEITSADPTEVISRQHDVEIAFSCSYPKRTNLTLGFRHKNPYAFIEKGFGAFTFEFEFFESQRFRQQVDASSYPLEVYLKQMIFMQIEATTFIPNTELFVESCKATPYDNHNSHISYTIIENGCVKDKTLQIYPSSKSQFRFGMEAFEFIGAHEEVYITCSVLLCESGVPGTRCSQGCTDTWNNRRKRDVSSQSSSHSISQGPLQLVKTSDTTASGPGLNLGLNTLFIAGCLIVCGVVIYRSRRARSKYQLLPTSDTE